jgi:hypothetical protein
MQFHHASGSVVAPQGIKRVGSASTINTADGCTLMVTMDVSNPTTDNLQRYIWWNLNEKLGHM